MVRINLQRVVKALRENLRFSPGHSFKRQSTKSNGDIGFNMPNYARYSANVSMVGSPVLCIICSVYFSKQRLQYIEVGRDLVCVVIGNESRKGVVKALIKELGVISYFVNKITIKKVDAITEIQKIQSDVHLFIYTKVGSDLKENPFGITTQQKDVPSNIKKKSIIIEFEYKDQFGKLQQYVQDLKKNPFVQTVCKGGSVSYINANDTRTHSRLTAALPYVFFGIALYLFSYGLGHIGWHIKTVNKTVSKK